MSLARSRRSRGRGLRVLATVVALGVVAAGCSWFAPRGSGVRPTERAAPPLSHEGRWFTDTFGRVVLLHGTNFVQ